MNGETKTPTPRTDRAAINVYDEFGAEGGGPFKAVPIYRARQLEAELTALQSDVRRLVDLLKIQHDNAENYRNEAHFHGDLDSESYNRGKVSVLEDVIDYFERANNPSLKPE